MNLDQAAADFACREWSEPHYSDWDALCSADVPVPEHDWAIVDQALHDERITSHEYEILERAAGPIRARPPLGEPGQPWPHRPGVSGVLDALAQGRITLAAAAADFESRDCTVPSAASAWAVGQDDPAIENDWAEVEEARRSGRITQEQCEVLRVARGPIVGRREPP